MPSNKAAKRKIRIRVVVRYLILVPAIFFFLFPLVWLATMSIKSRAQTFAIPPVWLFIPTLENYFIAIFGYSGKAALEAKVPLGSGLEYPLLNSIIIGFGSTAISVIVGSLAAYAFARFNFKGSKNIAVWILSTRMGPPVAIAMPLFFMANTLGLLDTHLMVILAYTSFQIPFVIWVMRGFFMALPTSMEESAMMDGASRFGAFWRIVVPLTLPGLITVTIFSLIFAWNDVIFALVLTRDVAKTAPLATIGFVEDKGILWGPLTASAITMTIPIIILTLLVQNYIVRGLTFGAVKE